MKVYTATKKQLIDGYKIDAGQKLGTDSGSGFDPEKQYPRIGYGHIQARIARGLVSESDEEVAAKKPYSKKTTGGK